MRPYRGLLVLLYDNGRLPLDTPERPYNRYSSAGSMFSLYPAVVSLLSRGC
ncbi:hypothetical protein [uncultured Porphyromonas sp.]|uniref:hypothetical protein n=1 Tax=uncultured Porphyromonas sp. TaxID=159274 RepID=UPI0026324127|nr:hypothetical protein [uncultured Porphyromonas sp.]